MKMLYTLFLIIGFQFIMISQKSFFGFDFGLGSTAVLNKTITLDTTNQITFRNRLNLSMELKFSHHFPSNFGFEINYLTMNNKYYFFSDSTYNYYSHIYQKIPLSVFRKWGNDDAFISIGIGLAPIFLSSATSKTRLVCINNCNNHFINHTDKLKKFNVDYFFNVNFSGITKKKNIVYFSFNYYQNLFLTDFRYLDNPFNIRFRNYSFSIGGLIFLKFPSRK